MFSTWNIPRVSAARLEAILAPLAAILLGVALLYLAGFAEMQAVHNAAHDARHAASLPCH